MTAMSRRTFLRSTAAGGGVLLAGSTARPAAGPTYSIQGVDCSKWQGNPTWTAVKAAGTDFAFVKATEGTTYTDPVFAANWAKMKAAGLTRGAYHFGRPGSDPVAQANHFYNTVKPTKGDLQLALDIEATDGKTPAQVKAWIAAFIGRVKALTGRPGIIYTGFYFWRDSAGNGPNLDCPLWLAAYVADPAKYVPAAWGTWSFWQYTDAGKVNGIGGNVDRDAWNGSAAGLAKLGLP